MVQKFLFSLGLLALIISSNIGFAQAVETKTETKTIRWVLAHEPVTLFLRAATHFAQEVEKESQGKLKVEVLTVQEYSRKYANGKMLSADVVESVQSGSIQMSQTYTRALGRLSRDMYVLDMPFLFRDHQHAANVLEGATGQRLLASLETSKLKGLAFTYSGGYRILPSEKPIRTIGDFKGLKVRTSNSPVALDTFAAVGAIPIPGEIEDVGVKKKAGRIAAAESTYARFFPLRQDAFSRVVNETNHSLFLTSVIINQEFFNGLTPELQALIRKAALSAARLERAESIVDGEKTREQCKKEGIQIAKLSDVEIQKFKKATEPVYKKYEDYFTPGLIKEISSAK